MWVWLGSVGECELQGAIARRRILVGDVLCAEKLATLAVEMSLGAKVINTRVPDKGSGNFLVGVVAQDEGAFFKCEAHRDNRVEVGGYMQIAMIAWRARDGKRACRSIRCDKNVLSVQFCPLYLSKMYIRVIFS